MTSPDFQQLAADMRLALRRHDLRENERLVAECLVDLSFSACASAAVVRQMEQLAALTGIRLDRVRLALEQLRAMQIIADISESDRGVTFYLQTDAEIWKCRVRVDAFSAAVITRDLSAEAKRDPAQLDLLPADRTLGNALAEVCLEKVFVSRPPSVSSVPSVVSFPKNRNSQTACASGSFPKNGNPPLKSIVRDTVKELSKGGFPKNGKQEAGHEGQNHGGQNHQGKPKVPGHDFAQNDFATPPSALDRFDPDRYAEITNPTRRDRSGDYVDPHSLDPRDLMERLRRALGEAQMEAHGGAWYRKCQRCPKLVRLALNEIEKRDDIRDPLHFALDLMKRGPRDYPALCKPSATTTPHS